MEAWVGSYCQLTHVRWTSRRLPASWWHAWGWAATIINRDIASWRLVLSALSVVMTKVVSTWSKCHIRIQKSSINISFFKVFWWHCFLLCKIKSCLWSTRLIFRLFCWFIFLHTCRLKLISNNGFRLLENYSFFLIWFWFALFTLLVNFLLLFIGINFCFI